MDSGRDTRCRVGFPIRTSADQRSLASPRGFSQRATSFIASWRQGIHRTPLSRSISHHHRPHAGPNRALHDKLACHTNRLTQGHRTYFQQPFIQPIHLHLSKNTPGRIPSRGPTPGGGYLEACITQTGHANPTRGRTAGASTPTSRAISRPVHQHHCLAPASLTHPMTPHRHQRTSSRKVWRQTDSNR